MKITMFQIDAFTQTLFGGNPAAICILRERLPETTMQAIAAENNLAETAFIVEGERGFEIRWFTPVVEVDLCGHATLAAAHVFFNELNFKGDEISFWSHRSGALNVRRKEGLLTLDFPMDVYEKVGTPAVLLEALGIEPMETFRGKTDYMVVLPNEEDVLRIAPDFELLSTIDGRGVIATAEGTDVDFVSRFFGPESGINEDPVTGSAHTTLTPYWAGELGKNELTAIQVSTRRGHLWCRLKGDRVEIAGYAVTYLRGEIEV
ncbi:MAG: PhzF family phenazine biosynthesis protein [Taibaiella sp.]|nr:PhzF family phenazine biosynthesis protein [Taibaiella sp.]